MVKSNTAANYWISSRLQELFAKCSIVPICTKTVTDIIGAQSCAGRPLTLPISTHTAL